MKIGCLVLRSRGYLQKFAKRICARRDEIAGVNRASHKQIHRATQVNF